MPLYKYKCKTCDQVTEQFKSVSQRHEVENCSQCGGEKKLLIGNFNRGFVLEPQYFEHLDSKPVWIKNKKHLKQECEKRGVTAKCLDGI